MQNRNNRHAASESERPSEALGASPFPWHSQVGQLLTQAAMLCVEHDVDLDAFMKGAWSAYVETRPGMRDFLEEMHLRDQLEEIRKAGRMGEA